MSDILQTCRITGKQFVVSEADQVFYDKISPVINGVKYPIPIPTIHWQERERRRMAWRNEREYYQRTCDGTGNPIVSVQSPKNPMPVYQNKYWWSDKWDPLSYGRDFDFSRSFFDQWQDLQNVVPQIAMMNDDGIASENCEYCQDVNYSKNCYLTTGTWKAEDAYYCQNSYPVKDVVDCYVITDSELCYECAQSSYLYRCAFLQDSHNCSECYFGQGLQGCKNCFACVNLVQKQYCIFNQQYSKEEYEQKMKAYNTGSAKIIAGIKQQFTEFRKDFPRKFMNAKACENCTGNNIQNCKDSEMIFELQNTIHSKYIYRADDVECCYDMLNTGGPKWSYEGITPDESYMTHFCMWCWKCQDTLYSDNCHNCQHIFACSGLKRKKYCILNKQYTQQEYDALMPRIIEHMKETEEWGEFFPAEKSFFAYNETVAQDHHSLTRVGALARGYRWRDDDTKMQYQGSLYDIDVHISDIGDDICDAVLLCEVTGKAYRILKPELAFYRKMNLPIPRRSPNQRYQDRVKQQVPIMLFDRKCDNCSVDLQSSYSPDVDHPVYCEQCYLESVY